MTSDIALAYGKERMAEIGYKRYHWQAVTYSLLAGQSLEIKAPNEYFYFYYPCPCIEPIFPSRETLCLFQAIQYISDVNAAQLQYFVDNGTFAPTFGDLGLSIPASDDCYTYTYTFISPGSATLTATPIQFG